MKKQHTNWKPTKVVHWFGRQIDRDRDGARPLIATTQKQIHAGFSWIRIDRLLSIDVAVEWGWEFSTGAPGSKLLHSLGNVSDYVADREPGQQERIKLASCVGSHSKSTKSSEHYSCSHSQIKLFSCRRVAFPNAIEIPLPMKYNGGYHPFKSLSRVCLRLFSRYLLLLLFGFSMWVCALLLALQLDSFDLLWAALQFHEWPDSEQLNEIRIYQHYCSFLDPSSSSCFILSLPAIASTGDVTTRARTLHNRDAHRVAN